MVISPFLVGDRGRAFSNFGKFFSVSRMHLLEGIFASGIIVEGSFFFSSSSSSSSRAATETGKRNAQKRLLGGRRRRREIERNRRRRGGWQPRTPTPPPRRGPVLGFYVLTSFHSVYESPLRFTTDHRGPFLSARFYRPVYAGRRAKGKGRETRRRSLRWKGGRQKQHRRYLRIFPSHACMRDPLDGYAVRSISGVEIGVDFSNSPAECYSLVLRSRKCPPKVARFGGEFGREGARRR